MATPLPTSPLVLPTYSQDRGTILVDPITKSTRQKPSGFAKNDVCDRDAYRVVSSSLSINQLSEDCQTVLAASGSISVTLPYNAVVGDIDTIVNAIVVDLKARLTALQA